MINSLKRCCCIMPISKMDSLVTEFKQYGGKTPFFSLNGTNCWARVTNIYDGDTFKIVIKLFDSYYKFNIRMFGIDTCELKSKEEGNKKKAIMARNRILQLICPSENINLEKAYTKKELDGFLESNVCLIWVNLMEFDKYGRVLLKAFINDKSNESFSQILIREKLGYEYFGDTKLTEEEQLNV